MESGDLESGLKQGRVLDFIISVEPDSVVSTDITRFRVYFISEKRIEEFS